MEDENEQRVAEDIARGLAHHINNVLASIIGNISVARAGLPPADPVRGRLDAAEKASFRLQELAERLQLYARRVQPALKRTALASLLEESLAETTLRTEQDVPADVVVQGDASLLRHAIRELIENSREAGGTTLRVQVRLVEGCAEIRIADNGPGIDPALQSTLFDPFITTRQRGRGLGLAIVASVMKLHEGTVCLEPSEEGAVFLLRLPGESSQTVRASGPDTGQRVLILDDEPGLRDVLGDIIRLLGHEVTTARNTEEARRHSAAALALGRPFTLAILDLVIPGEPGGAELLPILRQQLPGLKAIVSSGYWAEATAHLGPAGFQAALIKPFSLNDVRVAVEEVLSGDPPAG